MLFHHSSLYEYSVDRGITTPLMLMSLVQGFVRENPTAPIQVCHRRTSLCLNEFCRLGCICSSLSHSSRTGHCGRPVCMFGCSCLKQKVVLLKNLDSPDTSPGPLTGSAKKRKRRRRRMKMAYGEWFTSAPRHHCTRKHHTHHRCTLCPLVFLCR